MKKYLLSFAFIFCILICKAQTDNDPQNDNFFTADTLALSGFYIAMDTAQLDSSIDVDWFKVHLNRGGLLVVNLQPFPLGNAIQMNVATYDSSVYITNPIPSAYMDVKQAPQPGFPITSAVKNQLCAGVYYIKVDHVSGNVGTGSYILNIKLDTLEQECNDVSSRAVPIPSDTCFESRIQGIHHSDPNFFPGIGVFGVAGDVDWYQIHLLAHDSLKVEITNAPVDQQFAIYCYNSLSTTLMHSIISAGNGLDVTLGCLGLDSGIWQFQIWEYNDNNGTGNSFTVSDSTYHICFSSCGNVGVNEHPKNFNFSIYPNPSSSMLNIEVSTVTTPVLISIINTLGETIYQTISDKNKTIDVSQINEGIYFIKIQNKEENLTKKFVKQ